MTDKNGVLQEKIMVLPSLLAADSLSLQTEITDVEKAGADMLHFDVMDGHFVPNLTVGPQLLRAIRSQTELPLDVHLMISNAEQTIDNYIDSGADYISVHPEVVNHLHRLLQHINDRGKKAAVALNPHTPLAFVEHVLHLCHHVLIMTVNPGYGGQSFVPQMLTKISDLRQMIEHKGVATLIEVDGGINAKRAVDVINAGAHMLVAGTAIFGEHDRKQAIEAIRTASAVMLK